MACNNLIDITTGECLNNSGGIFYAKVFDMTDVTAYTVDDNTYEVDTLTTASSSNVVELEFRRNTSTFTSEGAIDLIGGSTFQIGTINFVFHRREAAKSKAIKIMGEGQRYLGVAIEDANGKRWYFPNAQVSAIGEGAGTARADGSKYSVTLVNEMNSLEYELPEAIWLALGA